jgi:prolyl-tRNA editing enzyme YbaK/EbsC (Cys-tRNA(Pro) deacylase)
MASVIPSPIDERLRGWLEAHEIAYQIHEHPLAYTALATAHAEGVDPATFAKVVGVRTDAGRVALVVLDAVDALDLRKVADLVGSPVSLMTERELTDACPDWEVGTVPPVPTLAGEQVFADEAIRGDEYISFNAGSHRVAVRLERRAWEEAADITYGDVARRAATGG